MGALRRSGGCAPEVPAEVPFEIPIHQNGKTVLKAQLTGTFPGSPVTVHFDFVLEAGKILSLEIHP